MIKRLGFLLLCLLLAPSARAADYAAPTLANIVRTLVRFDALDLKDDALLDEYAMITDCDIFQRFYGNDFQWQKVRGLIREDVQHNLGTYPMAYSYDAKLQLDRYDFQKKIYRFTEKTALHSINVIDLYHGDVVKCGERRISYIPVAYRVFLDVPVSLPGLPLAEKDADVLLVQMDKDGNADHTITARFNLHVIYIDPLRKASVNTTESKYMQSGKPINGHGMRLDARLDSVQFYEDPAMTRPIYTYRPQ